MYFNWNYRQACATTPVSPPVTPPVGNPPVATALTNQTATVGTAFSLHGAPDFGGTAPVVYAATGLPQSLSFDATTRTISGTPSVTAVATVVVSASNAAGQVSGQFTLTVNPAPVVAPQPVAPTAVALSSQTATVGTAFTYTVRLTLGEPPRWSTPPRGCPRV